MAAREQMGTNVEPSLVQRLAAGLRYVVTGVGPENWFGPQQPLAPQAQDKTEGRAFDYPVGYNLRIQPREGEAVSFATLRGLADGYDLLRLAIETRKDQVEAFEWEVVPKDKDKSADSMAAEIRAATDFLQQPDKEHDWPQWLRAQLEDMFVVDAMAVYPSASRGGQLYALELVDPATLKRVIDDGGRTPLPPSPAYQQVLKGIPAADYTRDQLVYSVRNFRTNKIYGYSPVEQVIMTVSIAMRRQLSQLDFYTQGNVPEAIAQVPETWTAKQIGDFQLWWDSIMEGNQAARRKMRFVPSLKDIVFPKKDVLKDEYDEWLARIVCYALSISPTALVKQVNRASGEQMADTAKEEGLLPLLRFLEYHMNRLLVFMGYPGLAFRWKVQNKVDPKTEADVAAVYVDRKVLTPDEVREDLGRDALTPEQREAAWPTPVEPEVPEPGAEPGRESGKEAEGKKEPAEEKEAKPTEQGKALERALELLAGCLEKLDPAAQGALLEKMVRAQPPTVVEFRPEVSVEVGDTTVHAHVARDDGARTVVTERRADGTVVAKMTRG